ncbi:MAG: hypothetical protein R6V12_13410, partial [Candidatus Hydrogenedentota bacterium]
GIITNADVSVRSGLMDGLESPSSVTGAWLVPYSWYTGEAKGKCFPAPSVTPAKAGAQCASTERLWQALWIPACAEMTVGTALLASRTGLLIYAKAEKGSQAVIAT